ncbi:uncharacterized protein LOC141879033 isoform X1 [Acropora palmata]|uniref:uncharacterized protein LOC141879033 isoform X1 n=1 Tax=Acropora palmata TaxID=6131 RepID=UPI003D9FBB07
MAAKESAISDGELRRKLTALGEDVGPITPTTKSFLMRKLKRLQNEAKTSRGSKEKTPSKRGTSPSLKSRSSRALSRTQSPSRKFIGFSSDEEDAGPSLSSTFTESGKLRFKRRGLMNSNDDLPEETSSQSTQPSPLRRRSYDRVPSLMDNFSERTLYTTEGNSGEFSDQDGQVPRQSISNSWRRTPNRDREERERPFLTVRASSTYDTKESANVDSKLNSTLRERPAGAEVSKGSSTCSSTGKIVLVISGICVVLLLCAALKWHLNYQQPQLVTLPICKEENSLVKFRQGEKPLECAPVLNISQQYAAWLYKWLSEKAGLCDCEYASCDSRNLSRKSFEKRVRNDNSRRKVEDQKWILNTTLELILNNSYGKLRLFDENDTATNDINKVKWIDCAVSMKPLFCRIREAMSRLAYLSSGIGCVIGGLVFVYFVVRQRWRREEQETRMMYQFVEKIIEILREHHQASKTEKTLLPYLPIPHVRDMLIPPSDRQRLLGAWNRAVRFLSGNESRIRVESQRIAGEDFEVWRWIQVATPKANSPKSARLGNKRGKYWQGQAFENFQSAVNPPVISPTPCLKIRNMFDPAVETEDGWHVMIQDAILEKCIENGAGVVHIAVDKSSVEGCVYVKCDTHHSAGLAFRSLHGCWFDGRLVAVKYLTLKRYHQRFPVAMEATERINPSGTSPSSLVVFDPATGDEDVNDSDIEL